jgi:hypothetical protein
MSKTKYTLAEQTDILKKNFNNYAVILSDFLAGLNMSHSFKIYHPYIEQLSKENSNKLIDVFVLSALKYETYIMQGDESFFLGKNYDEELNDVDKEDNMIRVFEFKTVWNKLDGQDKDMIKSYMKLLCRIARKYFDLLYGC